MVNIKRAVHLNGIYGTFLNCSYVRSFILHVLRDLFVKSAVCLFLSAAALHAQEEILPDADGFPSRPVRIVVYTSPGGLIDFTARKFAEVARKYTTVPFVVINKPGAGGVVAFDEVLQMPADGYTMLAVTRSNISKIIASQRDDLIDGVDWFAYVMDNPHVVITNPGEGLDNWQEVYQDALDQGGRQLWLGADIGGVKHVSGVKMWRQAGIEARWIPYESGGRAVAALLGGMGATYLGNPSDVIGKDDLKIVAVAAPERMRAFPDVPTFRELGIDGLENERIWRGFAFRQGMPDEVREWYRELFRRVTSDPEWVMTWIEEGINVDYQEAPEFRRIVEQDREEFRFYLREMGLLRERGDRRSLLAGVGEAPAVGFFKITMVLLNLMLGLYLLRSKHRPIFGELMVLAFLSSVAVVFFVVSEVLPPASEIDSIGAGGIPRLWIFVLVPLALYQTWLILRERAEKKPEAAPMLLFFVIGAAAVYMLLIPWVGYLVASAAFVPLLLWMMEYKNRPVIAAITVSWLAFAYFVFQKTLHVDLPLGRLFGG